MRQAFLKRIKASDPNQGTPGIFTSDKGFTCRTLELPDRDNAPNMSCIPAGTYLCTYRYSKKYRNHYLLHGVDGRTYILHHSGNLAGDTEKGYKTHSHGCILVGKYHGTLKKQFAVLCSKPTLRRLVDHFEKQSFELEIRNYPPCTGITRREHHDRHNYRSIDWRSWHRSIRFVFRPRWWNRYQHN